MIDVVTVLIDSLMSLWWIFPIALLVGLFRGARFRGWLGEKAVSRTLKRVFPRDDAIVLDDVILPTDRGTTQIDHVVVSRFGVFVVETKNYSGRIVGATNRRQWTQMLGGRKYKFQNPLHQNYKHVLAVKSIAGLDDDQVVPLIVFAGAARFVGTRPNGVLKLSEISKTVRSYETNLLNPSQVESVLRALQENRIESTVKTRREHRETLPIRS